MLAAMKRTVEAKRRPVGSRVRGMVKWEELDENRVHSRRIVRLEERARME